MKEENPKLEEGLWKCRGVCNTDVGNYRRSLTKQERRMNLVCLFHVTLVIVDTFMFLDVFVCLSVTVTLTDRLVLTGGQTRPQTSEGPCLRNEIPSVITLSNLSNRQGSYTPLPDRLVLDTRRHRWCLRVTSEGPCLRYEDTVLPMSV